MPIFFSLFYFCLLRVWAGTMVSYIFMSLTSASQHPQDIGWLRSITNLPILIKGVLTREDGRISILWYLHLIIIILSLLLLMKMVRSRFISDIHISILHLLHFLLPLVIGRTFHAFWNLMKISVIYNQYFNHYTFSIFFIKKFTHTGNSLNPSYLWNFNYRSLVNHPD